MARTHTQTHQFLLFLIDRVFSYYITLAGLEGPKEIRLALNLERSFPVFNVLESQACINRLCTSTKCLQTHREMLIQGCLLAVWSVTSEYWKVPHVHPQEDAIKVPHVHP